MWREAQCCQGWCCHFTDRFCLTARRLRASPQRESLIKFPFIPASSSSSPGITLHYNTLTYARILLCSFCVFPFPLSSLLLLHSLNTTRSRPSFSPSITSAVVSLNIKRQNCGRIPPVQVSVMCCDKRTWRQRDLLIMKHRGPKLPHWERGCGE